MSVNIYDCQDDSGADPRGPAWSVRTNDRGIVVGRIRFWALEGRDATWEARERRRLPGIDFDLQHGETYDVPVGSPYWPIFAERVTEIPPSSPAPLERWRFQGYYIRDCPAISSRLPVILGLDGGLKRPALELCQYDPGVPGRPLGVLWAIRELRVEGFQAGEFIALIRFMLGMATMADLEAEHKTGQWSTARAIDWIREERRNPFYGWEMPWVSPGTPLKIRAFMAKHESKQQNQMAVTQELNSLRKLYRQQGITLYPGQKEWDHRDVVMGFLLREGPVPGVPRLLLDSSCKWLAKGMAGGLVLPPPAQQTGGPLRDRMFEDVYDALCNAACSVFPLQQADKLVALEAQQARMREAAARREGASWQHGVRWQAEPQVDVASWGGLRRNYEETGR